MASVKVAVRVRPLNEREMDMESKFIIQMDNKKTSITNMKIPENSVGDYARDRTKDFTFDFSYWSVNKKTSNYASQEQVFQGLGLDVVQSAYEGYNACVFAYGQTGSGKTYTMMGSENDEGLIPRICRELFSRMSDENMTYRTEVSYLEIYNEKVRDLLKSSSKVQHSLRVREHPKDGPYVQDLSKHLVMNFEDIKELMDKGNNTRTTASTLMNDVSSRSHAIFTIVFTQAKFSKESPLETESKVHLVDLAGSERADATGATGQRLKEGGSINKSLVTLGNVISALADLSEKAAARKSTVFIPYRDSVLTWLLKDSLGGNAKTMMIATISPADCNYGETMSTLRYANRAKNIINKPRINEDPNVKLIRELREEIHRLRVLLGDNINKSSSEVQDKLYESEAKVKILTEEWAEKWGEITHILQEESTLALRKEGVGVVLDSDLPHLIGIDDDILSTGIMLYHLKTGETTIGTEDADPKPDIVLQGLELEPVHCTIVHVNGSVLIRPNMDALCTVNGTNITKSTPLTQGAVVVLGKSNMFRFNHPGQVAQLKKEFKGSNMNLSRLSMLSQSMTDLCRSTESLAVNSSVLELEKKHQEQLKMLETKRVQIEEMEERIRHAEMSRLSEQQEQEQALDEKKMQLEKLQEQAELIKDQAQKAQRKAEHEVAKYKRRSMDAERVLQDFMEQQISEPSGGDARISDRHKHNNNISCKEKILNELEKEIERKKERLLQEKDEELKLLLLEREQLEVIKQDCNKYNEFAEEMEYSTRERLKSENEELIQAKNNLTDNEQEVYQQYKKEEKQILQGQDENLKEVENEKWKLQADKIYVRELETNLEQLSTEVSSEKEREELDKEQAALQEEKTRISIQEKELEERQHQIKKDVEQKLASLQQQRNHQIHDLNQARSHVRDLEKQWHGHVEHEIETKDRTIEEVSMRIEDWEEELEVLEGRHRILSSQIHGPTLNGVNDKANTNKPKMDLLDSDVSAIPRDTSSTYESSSVTDPSLNSHDSGIRDLKKGVRFVDTCTSPHVQNTPGTQISDGYKPEPLEDERTALVNKMHELHDLEEQLKRNELDLNGKLEKFEEQRKQEQISLTNERLSLQEMEDQDHFNTLVEQEVRRRLTEQRLETDNKLSEKHLQERLQREREMARIRKAHLRELKRLRQQTESGLPTDNQPTRANPYAAYTTGSATCSLSRPQTKRAVTARSVSIASIHPGTSTLSQITGNPMSVSIPGYLHRGSGFDVYYEYEIKLSVINESWSVFRRYRRFLELHNELKLTLPENYLSHVLEILWRKPESPLHPTKVRLYCKKVLCDFNPFFKKGVFETGKYSTG